MTVEFRTHDIDIPEGMVGLRLDQALARLLPQYSRQRLQGWIESGAVKLNGAVPRSKDRILGGEQVRIAATIEPETTVAAESLPVDLVYEDEALRIINKPAGVVVHPGAGNPTRTLQNALLGLDPKLALVPRAGLIHRLDKDTSGLMVVGKTLEAVTALSRAIAAREVSRQYLALAHGTVDEAFSVMSSIGRDPVTRVKMAVVPAGKAARTDVQRLLCGPWQDPATDLPPRAYSGVLCTLHTGRTHQIRVHLSSRKHPLVADALYGGTLALGMRRQALHAAKLSFKHPITGDALAFEAPLPDDMAHAWAALTSAATANSQTGV